MEDVHVPATVRMAVPSHPLVPFSSVLIPSATAAQALDAVLPGGTGAERTPSNVMSSPIRAPGGGDNGSTLFLPIESSGRAGIGGQIGDLDQTLESTRDGVSARWTLESTQL